MKTEYLITFGIVVVAVLVASWISGKMKLNSYEEYYEAA